MPRIVFLNRDFAPDHSATSQMLSDLAFFGWRLWRIARARAPLCERYDKSIAFKAWLALLREL